uniref:Papilin n=1 Tax=Romanomermis culicivorax TaxID=13658 RepID=A0A915JPK7_ROMCU
MLITPFICCYIVLYSHFADALVTIDTSQESIGLHLSSPRHKRQAYPVFSASEGKLVIDSVGQTESGPWEDWTDGGAECSRTCGGGVKIETRKCSGSNCVGSRKRYVSCNTEPCEKGTKDFRHQQCSVYDDKPLEGKYYKWKAYTKGFQFFRLKQTTTFLRNLAPNKCELTCMPIGENFYYKWADKVVDGTKCDDFSNDICVEGFCLPLGCDNKLGSLIKDDKCGVCGGDGTTCKTMRGFFDEKHTGPRYVDIITLPVGAASIMIEEMKPTNNYLALKNESGNYYLNGNYKIDFPQTLEIAGTLFEYERNRHGTAGQEKIFSKGPLAEPVVVALLYQAEHTGIAYEYTLPLDETLPYHYVVDAWEPCSATCGKGIQSRKMTCVDKASQQPVSDDLCSNSSIPETNRTCNSIDCETEWFASEWEQCSSTCGDSGVQYRVVYCHKVSADGVRITVDDEECANMTRPEVKQSCNRFSCPEWQAGPWSSCSKECGSAHQYRAVTCRSEKSGEEGKLVPAKQCNSTLKPTDKRTCNLGPCEGLRWATSEWELCSKCNDTTEYRNVSCEDPNGKRYPEEKCKDSRPEDSRKCVNVVPCVYQWQASQWSECSSHCGHGHQTRKVYCTIDENGYLRKMDEVFCDDKLKPDARQNCTHEGEKCSGTFYSTQWSTCSVDCGGGTQNRSVVCLDYDFKIRSGMCDESEKPEEVQNCNIDPCLACNETEFGCCPDGATLATGLYLEGCSNCSETEFGCCPDNYTIATTEDMSECPLLTTLSSEGEFNATEIEASGDGEMVTETPDEIEEKEESATTTPNCSASEFGCCPDGNTTATTEDKSDCPEILCNYTSAAGES